MVYTGIQKCYSSIVMETLGMEKKLNKNHIDQVLLILNLAYTAVTGNNNDTQKSSY